MGNDGASCRPAHVHNLAGCSLAFIGRTLRSTNLGFRGKGSVSAALNAAQRRGYCQTGRGGFPL